MSLSAKEKEMLQAAKVYQKDTASISRSITEAHRRAVQDLRDDAERILETYARRGGFSSKAEAKAYMDAPMTAKEREVLKERARETLSGKALEQELIRLSAPAYKARMTRKDGIARSAEYASERFQADVKSSLQVGLDSTVTQAAKRTEYGIQKDVGIGVDMTLPNRRQMDQVQRGTGVYHKVKLWSDEELKTARTTITEGIMAGRSLDAVSKELEEQSGKVPYVARRLVRTTMAQAAADEAEASIKRRGIERYQIYCTPDERLCSVCAQYDGMICPVGKGPMPTFHPNCRCMIRAYIEDDEVRAEVERRRKEARGERRTKGTALESTKRMTYQEWQAKYAKEGVGDEARAEFRAGNAKRPELMKETEEARPQAEQAVSIERLGNRWEKPNSTEVRYYLDRDEFIKTYMGVDFARDEKHRIQWATVDGEDVSKSEANRIVNGVPDKLWYDEDGVLHYYTTFGESERLKKAVAEVEKRTKAEAAAMRKALEGLETDGYRIIGIRRTRVGGTQELIMYDLQTPDGRVFRDVRAGHDGKGQYLLTQNGIKQRPKKESPPLDALEKLIAMAERVRRSKP